MGLWGAEGLHGSLEALLLKLLEPERVTPVEAFRALKRGRRSGALWRVLTPLERALLAAAARARVREYKGPRIKPLLAAIIAKVESQTVRGLVLAVGLRRVLSIAPGLLSLRPRALLETLKRKLQYLLYLGRSILEVAGYHSAWRQYLEASQATQ